MNESDFNRCLEAARGGRLSANEEAELRAWLEDHPEAAALWQQETLLNAALDQLPDVPAASNFTALVLAALDQKPPRRPVFSRFALRLWLPRTVWFRRLAAASALIVLLGLTGLQFHRIRRDHLSHDLVRLSLAAASVPEPKVFQDFEAIRRLRHVPPPTDEALFDVLTQ